MPSSADTMHLGATLRLLRIDAGLSLRELAQRIGVSTAYLSRVEHGHDAVPTPERLAAIARELDLPPALLVDVAQRVSPYLAHYLEQVPGAGVVFLEIARRQLDAEGLLKLRTFIEREFPLPARSEAETPPPLLPLLAPERVLLQLRCTSLEDALDVAAGRLLAPGEALDTRALAAALRRREAEAPTVVGRGVAVPHAFLPTGPTRAALVTLSQPLPADTPDDQPLRLLVVVAGAERGRPHLVRMAHVARLAGHGLAERLAGARSPREALARLSSLEALR